MLREGARRYRALLALPGARRPVIASSLGSLPIGLFGLAILLLIEGSTGSFAYAGRVVETGTARELLERPRHPYTKALLEALPRHAQPGAMLPAVPGNVPTGLDDPVGWLERTALLDPGYAA